MINKFILFQILFLTILKLFGVAGGPLVVDALAVAGPRCGTKVCAIQQYCSSFHTQCENCDVVCEEKSHNFDQNICTEQCQDYLHEIRYIKSSNYAVDIQRLQKQQTIMLIVLIILLILFVTTNGIQLVRWMRKKDYLSFECLKKFQKSHKQKEAAAAAAISAQPVEFTHANPHTQSPKAVRSRTIANNDLRVKIGEINGNASTAYSISGVEGSTAQTVSTPLSKRYPAEDSTLDYSYDNNGLQISPIQDRPKTETTF